MSYQVLARKWRPKTFLELVGQAHVVQALTNALTHNRLHHAYLLTGTRGVGKTTIARILAKSLNCLTGVTATPCGVCPACVEIDAGRFVDLLELDAASNTGIDNMREILDNARYAPTAGRYKVYLIDEVHMLSKAAFNSMLKTLEEPPEHVKFVLATTDPQKIPVTVLSRCLQFNLKQLSPQLIDDRLQYILQEEGIKADSAATRLLAYAAQGSMRDALSLLDQAIAHGGGIVEESSVRAMLGAVDSDYLYRLLEALIVGNGNALLAEAKAMAGRSLSFAAALQDLASVLHRIAVVQTLGDKLDDAAFDQNKIADFAARLHAEEVQLFYQICITGQRDLALAPDEFAGFTMTLLRMLAFRPLEQAPQAASVSSTTVKVSKQSAQPAQTAARQVFDGDWLSLVSRLKLGIAQQLARESELKSYTDDHFVLCLATQQKHLAEFQGKLKAALTEYFARPVQLTVEIGEGSDATPAAQERREKQQQTAKALELFQDEPFVKEVIQQFDAQIKPGSVQPLS